MISAEDKLCREHASRLEVHNSLCIHKDSTTYNNPQMYVAPGGVSLSRLELWWACSRQAKSSPEDKIHKNHMRAAWPAKHVSSMGKSSPASKLMHEQSIPPAQCPDLLPLPDVLGGLSLGAGGLCAPCAACTHYAATQPSHTAVCAAYHL